MSFIQQFIAEHRKDDVNQLALIGCKNPDVSKDEWNWILQQIEGWQRTQTKLPTLSNLTDWWFPVRVSCEQCSSEKTANYKYLLIKNNPHLQASCLVDLTGGYGIDTIHLSKAFTCAHYIEMNEELCRIAQHNFTLTNSPIQTHNTTAEEYLQTLSDISNVTLYIDPARRSKSGSKVFKLEDCTPNIIPILPLLLKAKACIIKLSPMADIHAVLKALGGEEKWNVHIIAIHNEVKELLITTGNGKRTAIDLHSEEQITFTIQEENTATPRYAQQIAQYLYEPNSSLLKAGAYKIICEHYDVHKLAPNTHLYTSNKHIVDFPGRVWQVIESNLKSIPKATRANVVTRNYPLKAEQLQKKWRIIDGGEQYIIGTTLANKTLLLRAIILKQTIE